MGYSGVRKINTPAKDKKICLVCKKEFFVYKSEENNINKFCSRICKTKNQKEKSFFSRKGLPSPRKGVKLSDEQKQKMSDVKKGKRPNNYIDGKSRRMRMYFADGSHTIGEWENLKVQYNFFCPSCKRREPEIKLTQDHIIPLSKGGSDNIENIQPLCISCNSKKHTKIIRY